MLRRLLPLHLLLLLGSLVRVAHDSSRLLLLLWRRRRHGHLRARLLLLRLRLCAHGALHCGARHSAWSQALWQARFSLFKLLIGILNMQRV